ncbi:septum formation family protein [Luedemannella helvata]|uniref:Septum formation-related domain-containing protein n=1 Tax=Luedemannella helvata TaxID=349315 RepID=A0ABP4WGA2_9ACTN
MRRRGRLGAVAAAVLLALTLGACGVKTAGDADLTGDWAILPEAKVPPPANSVCRDGSATTVDWELDVFDSPPMACTTAHVTETYYVGTITDKKTVALDDPPGAGEPEFKSIYQTCVKKAADFLGGDYHRARVAVVPVVATDTQWQAGARFYRCELQEVLANRKLVKRNSSARDGLRGKKPLAIGCANNKVDSSDQITSFAWISCSKPHTMEFTGLYTHKAGKFPSEKTFYDRASAGCLAVGTVYTGHSVSQMQATGGFQWIFSGSDDAETLWNMGDRTHRCYLGAYPQKKRTGSIKGKLPSQW